MGKKNKKFFGRSFFPKNHKAKRSFSSPSENSFFPKNHKGISIMIGYVLLITFAVIMGSIVYQWMKTYVPKDVLNCPEGVSIFVEDAHYEGGNLLNVTIKNNGRFNIAGYFIHATNSSEQELATIDLSQNLIGGGINMSNSVIFDSLNENSMKSNDKIENIFDLNSAGIGQVYLIEITPVRFQEEDNKIRFVSCKDAKVKETIT